MGCTPDDQYLKNKNYQIYKNESGDIQYASSVQIVPLTVERERPTEVKTNMLTM